MLYVGNYTSACSKYWARISSKKCIFSEKSVVRKPFLFDAFDPNSAYLFGNSSLTCLTILADRLKSDELPCATESVKSNRSPLNFTTSSFWKSLFGRLYARSPNFADSSLVPHLAHRDDVAAILASFASSGRWLVDFLRPCEDGLSILWHLLRRFFALGDLLLDRAYVRLLGSMWRLNWESRT